MTSTVISYPIPAYQNLPIEAQFYEPSRFVISNITLGQTTLVTTTENVNYVIGQQVRILIPSLFGTIQLNEQIGYVLSLPAPNQVEINIKSIDYNDFISSTSTTKPQILAIGNINSGAINSSGRTLNSMFIPGSFIDISPI